MRLNRHVISVHMHVSRQEAKFLQLSDVLLLRGVRYPTCCA
jgi:hypothetical protein